VLPFIIRLTPASRPNKVGFKCMSALPYVRPQKVNSILMRFDVGTGCRVMHDGMQYDPIQSQGQGHEPLKVGNLAIFNGYLLPHL